MLLASWEPVIRGVFTNVIIWWIHWDFPFFAIWIEPWTNPSSIAKASAAFPSIRRMEKKSASPRDQMAASQWLWELSVHLHSEEAAMGSMGKACQHDAHRKPIRVRTAIFRGTASHCGARRLVGTILGNKMGPVTCTDSLLQLLTRLPCVAQNAS